MRELRVCRLTPSKVARAYPLIQLEIPELSLDAWRDFALDCISHRGRPGESDILAAEDPHGYVPGLLIYRINHSLVQGRRLVAEHLIALDIFRSRAEAVASILIQTMECLAQDQCCNTIRVEQINRHAEAKNQMLLGILAEYGYQMESLQVSKSFGGPD